MSSYASQNDGHKPPLARPRFDEDTLSEKPAIEQLVRMGYEFIPGEKLDPQEAEDCERSSRRDVVLTARLKRKLAELNPEATESTIDKAVRRATNLQGTSNGYSDRLCANRLSRAPRQRIAAVSA